MKNRISLNNGSIDENSREISFLEYFYLFVIIIYAGKASTFVKAESFTDNAVGYSLPIILSGILAIKWKIKFNKQFFRLISCLFIYFIAITFKYKELHLSVFTYHFFLFFIVFITIKALGLNFFRIYEFLMYYLAITAIGLWAIQTILKGDTLNNYLGKIPGIQEFSSVSGDGGLNAIIYSVQSTASTLLYNFNIPRNSGFAWEPGGFAVYLCLAIFVNLFMVNSNSKLNLHFWVLLVALVSTQSTTGYSIFIVLILFYYLNKKTDTIVLIIPLLLTGAIFVFSLPFMSNKIVKLGKDTTDVDYIVWESIGNESNSAPQRFASFLIALRDFYENPILGYAGIQGKSWYDKIGANISPISGLGNLLGTFGIVGFLFFTIASFKSSILLSKYFNYKAGILLFIIILLISVSYTIIFVPLIMCFWMFGLFGVKSLKLIDKNEADSSANNLVIV